MMGKLKRLISTIIILLAHCPFKTVYINFKTLPFKQALRLPIFVYSKTEFRSIKGRIVINGHISPNMIHIGDNTRYPTTSRPLSVWTINGQIVFNGPINFLQGTYVYVAENATLQFGTNGTFVGSDTKIICRDRIDIGNCVEITWECQIYDTSFHYIIKGGGMCPVQPLTKRIVINDYVWIGNRTTISRGTVVPSHSVIASGSLCNKDYSEYGQRCLYAGTPAKCKAAGIDRIFSSQEESVYDLQFGYKRFRL